MSDEATLLHNLQVLFEKREQLSAMRLAERDDEIVALRTRFEEMLEKSGIVADDAGSADSNFTIVDPDDDDTGGVISLSGDRDNMIRTASRLRWMPRVTHVDASNIGVADDDCEGVLSDLLDPASGLRVLDLSGNDLGENALGVLCTQVPRAQRLSVLRLDGNPRLACSKGAGSALASMIQASRLVHVDISFNNEKHGNRVVGGGGGGSRKVSVGATAKRGVGRGKRGAKRGRKKNADASGDAASLNATEFFSGFAQGAGSKQQSSKSKTNSSKSSTKPRRSNSRGTSTKKLGASNDSVRVFCIWSTGAMNGAPGGVLQMLIHPLPPLLYAELCHSLFAHYF